MKGRVAKLSALQFALFCDVAGVGRSRSAARIAPTILALSLIASGASAATATATVAISATVQATCTNTTTSLPFGTYTGLVATGTATVTVQCTNTTPYNVGLDAGGSTGATVTNRAMTGGAVLLYYGLFQDASHATNWGNSAGSWVAGTGNGANQVLTVYGQVAGGQYVTPGAYTDTITATVNY